MGFTGFTSFRLNGDVKTVRDAKTVASVSSIHVSLYVQYENQSYKIEAGLRVFKLQMSGIQCM